MPKDNKINYSEVRWGLSEQDRWSLMKRLDWFSDSEKRNMLQKELKAKADLNGIVWWWMSKNTALSNLNPQSWRKEILNYLIGRWLDIENTPTSKISNVVRTVENKLGGVRSNLPVANRATYLSKLFK